MELNRATITVIVIVLKNASAKEAKDNFHECTANTSRFIDIDEHIDSSRSVLEYHRGFYAAL
jgi:hypothetical protein